MPYKPSAAFFRIKTLPVRSIYSFKQAEDPPRRDESAALKAEITKSIKDLPPMPQVVVEIQNQLSQMGVNMQQAAKMIETDPGITSKVLRIANSAARGGLRFKDSGRPAGPWNQQRGAHRRAAS